MIRVVEQIAPMTTPPVLLLTASGGWSCIVLGDTLPVPLTAVSHLFRSWISLGDTLPAPLTAGSHLFLGWYFSKAVFV